MREPHIHAEIIKAWADGHDIEFYDEVIGCWRLVKTRVMPTWDPEIAYRILLIGEGCDNDQDL